MQHIPISWYSIPTQVWRELDKNALCAFGYIRISCKCLDAESKEILDADISDIIEEE
jgi:hypothetical protein